MKPSGGGALRQFLSKEVSKLVSKEEINHKFLLTYLPTNLLTRKRCAFTLAEGATHVGNYNRDRKAAFTLAEVLITLGVIGVVAAMTLPTLIQNHEKRVIETGLAKSYSDINNWLTRSELDNDSRIYWDYTLPTDEFVKKYFAPYVTLKECTYSTQGKCFKKENNTPINSWSYVNGNSPNGQIRMTSRKYLLPDGRAIAFMVNPGSPSYAKYEPYLGIWIDVNGPRGNSILGKDVYQMIMFNYAKWGQNMIGKPTFGGYWGYFGYSGVDHASLNDSENYAACERDNEVCGILLQRNGWKFPKDYPIKF